MKPLHTYYDNLQVAENASPEVVRGAYRFLAQKWHPDKNPGNRAEAERITKLINEAYEVLSDPDRRRDHDRWIAQQRETARRDDTESRPPIEEPNEPTETARVIDFADARMKALFIHIDTRIAALKRMLPWMLVNAILPVAAIFVTAERSQTFIGVLQEVTNRLTAKNLSPPAIRIVIGIGLLIVALAAINMVLAAVLLLWRLAMRGLLHLKLEDAAIVRNLQEHQMMFMELSLKEVVLKRGFRMIRMRYDRAERKWAYDFSGVRAIPIVLFASFALAALWPGSRQTIPEKAVQTSPTEPTVVSLGDRDHSIYIENRCPANVRLYLAALPDLKWDIKAGERVQLKDAQQRPVRLQKPYMDYFAKGIGRDLEWAGTGDDPKAIKRSVDGEERIFLRSKSVDSGQEIRINLMCPQAGIQPSKPESENRTGDNKVAPTEDQAANDEASRTTAPEQNQETEAGAATCRVRAVIPLFLSEMRRESGGEIKDITRVQPGYFRGLNDWSCSGVAELTDGTTEPINFGHRPLSRTEYTAFIESR